MRRLALVLLAALVAAGCATWPLFGAPRQLLAEADAAAERGEYELALHDYDAYLARASHGWMARRARVSRDAVAAAVATRAELVKLRHELAAREAELARLRDDLAQVRNDLERIKEIDLKREHPR